MKNIRRIGLSAVGIAAVSAAVALTAPIASADSNACPPSTTGTGGSGTGSASSLGPLINSILNALSHGGATSGGAGASVS